MIFIFGTKGRAIQKEKGRFYCPYCSGERNYTQFEIKKYFTLFFVPVLPIGHIANYVECDACQGQYKLEVLQETAQSMQVHALYSDAVMGMPLQMISKKLVNKGMSEQEAQTAVHYMANQCVQKQCTGCHLTFLADANLTHCTGCGETLR